MSFQPDDIVDITITGARVVQTGQDDLGRPFIEYAHGEHNTLATVDSDDPAVNVARVTPERWPPRPGDVWHDRHGSVWFGVVNSPEGRVDMVTATPAAYPGARVTADNVLAELAPLTLVHREGREA